MNKQVLELINKSNRKKRLRVWSVILTFFGDAILPVGGTVSANTVSQLMAELSIENGAVRTAFSRLTKDKWVIREKQGRQSFYRLAPKGHKPFKMASDKIYASSNKRNTLSNEWLLASNPHCNAKAFRKLIHDFNGMALDASTAVFNSDLPNLQDMLSKADFIFATSTSKKTPKWLTQHPTLKSYERELTDFIAAFSNLPKQLTPIEAMAVRCLLIHEWRRVLLKLPDLPTNLLPKNWPAEDALELVAKQYMNLLPASQAWLESEYIASFNQFELKENLELRFNTLQK